MFSDFFLHFLRAEEATEIGVALKQVKCETCGFDYEYQIMRSSRGFAWELAGGLETAKGKAQEELRTALREGCEPVACPNCGWVQRSMLARAYRLRFRWMVKAAWCMLPISIILASAGFLFESQRKLRRPPPDPIWATLFWVVAAICAALALVLPLLRCILIWGYNPNAQNPDLNDVNRR